MRQRAGLRRRKRRRAAPPPPRTEGVIELPAPATVSNAGMAAIATTHDRLRAILGSHLWKLGFVTETIDVPTEAMPQPDARWEVRVVARRRALRGGAQRRRISSDRLLLAVPCRVRRRLFGRLDVHYQLPPMHSLAPVYRLRPSQRRAHG
jgi:hypothetical protein